MATTTTLFVAKTTTTATTTTTTPTCTTPPQGDLFGYILDLTGGVTASLTSFVLPALAYLSATGGKASTVPFVLNGRPTDEIAAYRKGSWALLVFGCAVMVLVPSGVVFSIFSGK